MDFKKKERKHAFDQEKSKNQEKKENTPSTKKKVKNQDLDHTIVQEKVLRSHFFLL